MEGPTLQDIEQTMQAGNPQVQEAMIAREAVKERVARVNRLRKALGDAAFMKNIASIKRQQKKYLEIIREAYASGEITGKSLTNEQAPSEILNVYKLLIGSTGNLLALQSPEKVWDMRVVMKQLLENIVGEIADEGFAASQTVTPAKGEKYQQPTNQEGEI